MTGGRGRFSWGSFDDEVKMAKEGEFWRAYHSEDEYEETPIEVVKNCSSTSNEQTIELTRSDSF
jgi:hypothetical protein